MCRRRRTGEGGGEEAAPSSRGAAVDSWGACPGDTAPQMLSKTAVPRQWARPPTLDGRRVPKRMYLPRCRCASHRARNRVSMLSGWRGVAWREGSQRQSDALRRRWAAPDDIVRPCRGRGGPRWRRSTPSAGVRAAAARGTSRGKASGHAGRDPQTAEELRVTPAVASRWAAGAEGACRRRPARPLPLQQPSPPRQPGGGGGP